jgi:WD40 repeat protein
MAARSSGGRVIAVVAVGAFLFIGACGGGTVAVWYFVFAGWRTVGPAGDPAKNQKSPDLGKQKGAVVEPMALVEAELGKEGGARKVGHVFLSQDGRRMAISNTRFADAKSQIWEVADKPKKLHEFDGPIEAISPDGKKVIHSKKGGRFLVNADAGTTLAPIGGTGFVFFQSSTVCWTVDPYVDAQDRKKVWATSYHTADGKKGKQLEFDNKGDRFAGANENGELFFVSTTAVRVWDASAEKWTRQTALKPGAGETVLLEVPFAVSQDGKWLMANTGKATFDPAIFDLSTGTAAKIPGHAGHPHNPVFVRNGDLLMVNKRAGLNKYNVVAFDVKSNTIVRAFGTVESIATLAVSADGSTLAVGTWEGQVALWDLVKLK